MFYLWQLAIVLSLQAVVNKIKKDILKQGKSDCFFINGDFPLSL